MDNDGRFSLNARSPVKKISEMSVDMSSTPGARLLKLDRFALITSYHGDPLGIMNGRTSVTMNPSTGF